MKSMFLNILNHYFDNIPIASVIPLDVCVIAPDYYLYLCEFNEASYVVLEADYLSNMPGLVKDVEHAFSVKAEGWCTLKDFKAKADADMLPPDSDDNDPDGINDKNHDNYIFTVLTQNGMRYAVLRVKS